MPLRFKICQFLIEDIILLVKYLTRSRFDGQMKKSHNNQRFQYLTKYPTVHNLRHIGKNLFVISLQILKKIAPLIFLYLRILHPFYPLKLRSEKWFLLSLHFHLLKLRSEN